MLDLAVITDIHHGAAPQAPDGSALSVLERALGDHTAGAMTVVDLGDRITNAGRSADALLLAQVADVFRRVSAPRHHLMGNHDAVYLTPGENAVALGARAGSYSIALAGYRLVFWQPRTRFEDDTHGLAAGECDRAWLRAALHTATTPALVFTHFPLDGASMVGNYYFEGSQRHLAGFTDTPAILEVLRAAPAVVACVAGHAHWNHLSTIDGIHFITVQSLTETVTTAPEPAGAIARLRVTTDWIEWTTFGRDAFFCRLPARRPDRIWARQDSQTSPSTS